MRPFGLAVGPLAIAATAVFAPTAMAADVTPASCNYAGGPLSVCTLTTNRLMLFSAKGGELVQGRLMKTGSREVKGYSGGGSPNNAVMAFNTSVWDSWYLATNTRGAAGAVTFRATTGPLAKHSVSVDSDFEYWYSRDGAHSFSPKCPGSGYYACFLPKSYSHAGTVRYPVEIGGYASIESRPLIVKVLNMTDQPLVRSTEARASGAIRDDQAADPATIAPLGAGGPGVGYYHYYRDESEGSSVTASYTFGDGPGATGLTGSLIEINVNVGADGKTDASGCSVPEGGAVNVECSVTMLGLSDGILTALVSVGV